MSDNLPFSEARASSDARDSFRLGFKAKQTDMVGTCLRTAFDDDEQYADLPDDLSVLLRSLN